MISFIETIMNTFGYFGVFFLIFLENVFPFIPSEIILPFAGFTTTLSNSKLNVTELILISTLIAVVGGLFWYYIGKLIKLEDIQKFFEKKWMNRLHMNRKGLDKSVNFFNRWQGMAVLVGRCLPVIRVLISIPAGITKINIWKFIFYTTIGTAIWNTLLILLGRAFGQNWEKVANIIGEYNKIVIGVIALIIIVFIIIKYSKRKSS